MRFVVKRADVQQVQDKQQAAAQVCNASCCIIYRARCNARVQQLQLQLDEAERRHQLFVKRARFVTRPTAQAAVCDVCL
jgi:hypothetical protein